MLLNADITYTILLHLEMCFSSQLLVLKMLIVTYWMLWNYPQEKNKKHNTLHNFEWTFYEFIDNLKTMNMVFFPHHLAYFT